MPFCNLPETEVVNTLKHAFTKTKPCLQGRN